MASADFLHSVGKSQGIEKTGKTNKPRDKNKTVWSLYH